MCFGEVEIRPAQRMVLVEGRRAPLGCSGHRRADAGWVEHRDRIVSKQELLDQGLGGPDGRRKQSCKCRSVRCASLLGPQDDCHGAGPGVIGSPRFRRGRLGSEPRPRGACRIPLQRWQPAGVASPRLIGRVSEIADLVQQVRSPSHCDGRRCRRYWQRPNWRWPAAIIACSPRFEHGVWVVDLASVVRPGTHRLGHHPGDVDQPACGQAHRGGLWPAFYVGASCCSCWTIASTLSRPVGHLVQAVVDHTALVASAGNQSGTPAHQVKNRCAGLHR